MVFSLRIVLLGYPPRISPLAAAVKLIDKKLARELRYISSLTLLDAGSGRML
jgi:hypothetical protein